MSRFLVFSLVITTLVSLSPLAQAAGANSGPGPQAAGDFDNDGIDDLAVGAFGEGVGPEGSEVEQAGAVHVIYGKGAGLAAAGDQLFTQNDVASSNSAGQNDAFGMSLAVGDFDNDGIDDLAAGAPFDDIGAQQAVGSVVIFFGSNSGLKAAGSQFFHQDVPGVQEMAETTDRFGLSLAAGDLAGGAADDLVVGAPGESLAASESGTVHVFLGSQSGLATAGNLLFSEASPGIQDEPEQDEDFGRSLAVGNFGKSDKDDLAIGVPGERLEPEGNLTIAGAVHVLFGTSTNISSINSQFIHRGKPGVPGGFEAAGFGHALAAGNFGRSGKTDLAVGTWDDPIGGRIQAGSVSVFYGSRSRVSTKKVQRWHQNSKGMANKVENYDYFARTLESGNVGRSKHADLIVGVIGENSNSIDDPGLMHVLFGTSKGIKARNDQVWDQNSPGVPGENEADDAFGGSFAVGNFGKSIHGDISVGSAESFGDSSEGAGAVDIIYGSATGPTNAGVEIFSQLGPIEDSPEPFDSFGTSIEF